ncbi:hypothetical protein GCM10022237_44190 [Nocardioides ginsengisoli]|uniref:SpaA isopeptide-forming pilin-related protein n=1 Tax=Nocardioides ginsengisoli TaxID=363868 RepID=A0ABW3VYL1_9ACTN
MYDPPDGALRAALIRCCRLGMCWAVGVLLLCSAPVLGGPGGQSHQQGLATPLAPGLRTMAAGVPAPPIVVYREDFENGMGTTSTGAKSLTANTLGAPQYAGASGMTYTADTNWREGQRCSGVVLAYANGLNADDGGGPDWATTGRVVGGQTMANKCSPVAGVQSYNGIRTLARAMGQVVGGGDNDHIVSTYTECTQTSVGNTSTCDTLPTGQTTSRMFETQQQIAVTPNHFYTFAVDAVAGNCSGTGTVAQGSDPQYQFQLLNGATRTNVGSPMNPCRDASRVAFTVNRPRAVGATTTMSGYVSRLRADTAFIYSGSSLGVAMYDQIGLTNGNDGGFDNVEVRDVTPAVDKSFSPALLEPGQTSTLTLTITNTSDLLAKTDWGFVDTLPAGLTLTGSTFGGTCTQLAGATMTRTGAAGGNTITVTGGDLALNQTSCTITVGVTSAVEGSYTNSPTSNMTLTGLVPGAPGTVEFRWPRITLVKALGSARVRTADQFTVAIRTGSGTGTVVSDPSAATTTGSGSTVTAGTGTTGAYVGRSGTTYYLTESGAGVTDLSRYDATLTCVDATGATSGLPNGAAYTGSNSVVPATGAKITCTITNTAKPPTLRLTKTLGNARAADTDEFTVGIRTGSATGTVVSSTTNATTSGSGATVDPGTGTTGVYTATAGTTYYLTERAAGTTDLTSYGKKITCTDASGLQSGLPTGATFTDALTITPVAGAQIACVLTNTVTRQDVYLLKQAQQPNGAWSPINGSAWELHADNAGAMGPVLASPGVVAVSGQTGQFKIAGLTPGSYWVLETKAPDGTSLLAQPVRFTVASDGSVTLGSGSGTDVVTLATATGGAPELVVRNFRAAVLPAAGGTGTGALVAGGLAVLALAVLLGLALGSREARRPEVPVRP